VEGITFKTRKNTSKTCKQKYTNHYA